MIISTFCLLNVNPTALGKISLNLTIDDMTLFRGIESQLADAYYFMSLCGNEQPGICKLQI